MCCFDILPDDIKMYIKKIASTIKAAETIQKYYRMTRYSPGTAPEFSNTMLDPLIRKYQRVIVYYNGTHETGTVISGPSNGFYYEAVISLDYTTAETFKYLYYYSQENRELRHLKLNSDPNQYIRHSREPSKVILIKPW